MLKRTKGWKIYPLESKDWFFERYDTRALLAGIASRVLADELAPAHADNGIFWIRAEEEGNSSALKSYWLALSLTSFKYKKEKGLALLLDNVHQDKSGNEILSLARDSGEVFLEKPVLLKTKSPQNKKKGNQGGLMIKKKATKIIALTMFALSLFSTSTHALDDKGKGRDLYASCVSCHGETGNKVWLRSREIANLSKEEFVALSVGYQERTYGKESKIVMQNRLDEHTLEDIIKVAEYLGLK